jgi:hypothetical protein
MGVGIVVILSTLVLAGVVVVLRGWRGRKVNDHPHCSRCRFDLVGIYPGIRTCPECGTGLEPARGRKGVRFGARARQRGVIACGMAIMLIAATPLGIFAYSAATGTSIVKHLPMGALELMANMGPRARADEAVVEITTRLRDQTLDQEQSKRAVALVLAFQADDTRVWTRAWADLLEGVDLKGLLTPEQAQQVLVNGIKPVITARPTAVRGGHAVVEIKPVASRLGTNQEFGARYKIRNWRINGVPQESGRRPMPLMFEETPPAFTAQLSDNGIWQFAGPSVPYPQWMQLNVSFPNFDRTGTRVRRDTPIGPATLSFEVHLAGEFRSNGSIPSPVASELTWELSVPIKIVDNPDEVVQARTLTGADFEAFKRGLNLDVVNIVVSEYHEGPDRQLRFAINPNVSKDWGGADYLASKKVPDGVAFLARVEIDGKTYSAGAFVTTSDNSFMNYSSTGPPGHVEQMLRLPEAKTANLRLIPMRELAEINPANTWFLDAEIVLQDVPIKIFDIRYKKSTPLSDVRATPWSDFNTPSTIRTAKGNWQSRPPAAVNRATPTTTPATNP